MRIELCVLRYFVEIARKENITRAARRLHISQPTLSRQMKELEDELGRKLFTRSNYRIKLTEEGKLLQKRAEDILEMADKTVAEFKSLDEINGGDIYIGCAESNGIAHFIRVIKSLQENTPASVITFTAAVQMLSMTGWIGGCWTLPSLFRK